MMRVVWLSALAALVLAGCEATSSSPPPARPTVQYSGGENPSADQAVISDPCAAQLQDIAGAMLMYYSLNKRMPQQLSDLNSVTGMDTPFAETPSLHFSCPVSGLAYLYYPEGLIAPDGTGKIIVCDATAAHDGKRWCIVLGPPRGKALSLDVEELTEKVFEEFQQPGGQ